MQKSKLLAALQSEIRRHNFSTFYKKGVVVPGARRAGNDSILTDNLLTIWQKRCCLACWIGYRLKPISPKMNEDEQQRDNLFERQVALRPSGGRNGK
jgi:hypothetical protein